MLDLVRRGHATQTHARDTHNVRCACVRRGHATETHDTHTHTRTHTHASCAAHACDEDMRHGLTHTHTRKLRCACMRRVQILNPFLFPLPNEMHMPRTRATQNRTGYTSFCIWKSPLENLAKHIMVASTIGRHKVDPHAGATCFAEVVLNCSLSCRNAWQE